MVNLVVIAFMEEFRLDSRRLRKYLLKPVSLRFGDPIQEFSNPGPSQQPTKTVT